MLHSIRKPYWLTFKQALEAGGNVKTDEKGWPIVFWSFKEKEKADGTKESYGFLKRYTVFSDGIEWLRIAEV